MSADPRTGRGRPVDRCAETAPTLTDIARRVDDGSAGRIVSIGMELKGSSPVSIRCTKPTSALSRITWNFTIFCSRA